MTAKVTVSWRTGRPTRNDDYLVVDKVYWARKMGYYRSDFGWCINGRWLGHDAVRYWTELPDLPTAPQ